MPRTLRLTTLGLCFLLPLSAWAADAITGTVTNRTTGKPAAGDDVVLIRLQQAMQETTRTKTDARGHFKLDVPDDGMHLVRVTHDKANYFQPMTPGAHTADIDVYEAAPKVEGVTTPVEELHVEADGNELHVVEVLQVTNQSAPARTQFGPSGFDFYLPPEAHLVRAGAMRDGMPVPATAAPVGDPGHYTFLFPIRPGETQFGIFYSLPYTGKMTLPLRFSSNLDTVAVLLPASMTFKPGASSSFTQQPGSGQGVTWIAHNVSPSQTLEFSVSGTGQLPKQGQGESASGDNSGQPLPETQNTMPGRGLQNPLDPEGNRDPWAKYKWWILGGLALLLAGAAGVLLKRPANADAGASPAPASALPPQTHDALLLGALKEELFALETDHLQGRVPVEEYREARSALELVLRRALARSTAAPAATQGVSASEEVHVA